MKEHSDTVTVGNKNTVKPSWFESGTSRIYFEESGSGDPILLMPGFSMSITGLLTLRQALVDGGYRVFAADLPGSGRSLPQPRQYTASYFEDDARSFNAFLQELAIAPAHIMGFSDGGEVALNMAELNPNIARSVVTWGAAGVLNDPSGKLREIMFNIVDNPIPPLKQFRDSLVAQYGEANARAMTQSHVRAIGSIIESSGGNLSFSKAGTITCPVLLIAGEQDMFVSKALLSQLAGRIHDAKVIVAESAGHDVHNDSPEWFAQTILDWLKRHS